MSMGGTVLADRAQEKTDQLSVSPLGNDKQSGTIGFRFQHGRRITLHNAAVNREVRVLGTLLFNQMVEHLFGTHARIEIRRERSRPRQVRRPLPRRNQSTCECVADA